jgi:hypothetical protein
MDGLCQDFKIVSPFVGLVQQVRSLLVPGHQQHFAVRKNSADFNGGINACDFGHYNINNEHIKGFSVARVIAAAPLYRE